MAFIIGVDIGGTFTDAVAVNVATGEVLQGKTPSTPDDLTDGVFAAIDDLGQFRRAELARSPREDCQVRSRHHSELEHHVHLVRCSNWPHRDARLRRSDANHASDWSCRRPQPLGSPPLPNDGQAPADRPARAIREVSERVDYKGDVLVALDSSDAGRAMLSSSTKGSRRSRLGCSGRLEPVHEEALVELVRELAPDVPVTRSSEIAPVIGEYERTSTAVVNAYVGPLMVATSAG